MRTLLLFLTLLLAAPVQARMYQWVSPATHTTQLSGAPPSWYRSGTPGPRVFLFENGRIVDDTAIKVNDAERERLREEAFQKADELARAAPAPPSAPAAAQAGSTGKGESGDQGAPGQAAEAAAEPPAPDAETGGSGQAAGSSGASTKGTIERLKAIIADWDKKQTEHAKDVLDTESQLKQILKKHPPPSDTPPDNGP